MSTPAAVAAALGAAALFAVASAVQHHEARSVEPSVRPSLLLTLAKRPLWLAGTAADVAAVGVQALALRLGPVALVQGLLVAGLPLAVLLSAVLGDRRLHRAELLGLALCASGLAVLGPALAAASSGSEPGRAQSFVAALLLAAAVLALLTARRHARWGGAAAGAAAGAVVGAGAVLLAVAAGRLDDLPALLSTWAPYAAVTVGLLGLLLTQVAFQTGDLGAPLATLTVVEPVVAVLLAAALLHERLATDLASLVTLTVGGALAVLGVLVLSRPASDRPEEGSSDLR